jgi:hypothetical protein
VDSFTGSGSSFKYLIKKNKGKIKRIFYNLSPAFLVPALFLVLKSLPGSPSGTKQAKRSGTSPATILMLSLTK